MKLQSSCTFKITKWDEQTYKQRSNGAKLSKACVTQNYTGDIDGTSEVEYLMSHAENGTASFVGLELITATIANKKGSFVIQHIGLFGENGAQSNWTVLANSGTDALTGITGEGNYLANADEVEMFFTLNL